MQESYALSVEKRLQASEHWKVLAKQIADEVEKVIKNRPEVGEAGCSPRNPKGENEYRSLGPVYISNLDESSFGRAMHTIFTTEFIKHRVAITRDANSLFRLDWMVQPVVHKAERENIPSLLYIIFIGVPQALFLGEADFGFQSKPHTELIITFRLQENGIDIFRQTHIYSINDADIDHYWDISKQGFVKNHSEAYANTSPIE